MAEETDALNDKLAARAASLQTARKGAGKLSAATRAMQRKMPALRESCEALQDV